MYSHNMRNPMRLLRFRSYMKDLVLATLFCSLMICSSALLSSPTSQLSVRVKVAEIPLDLERIRECRRTESPTDGRPLLEAQKSFLQADAVARKKVTCLIVEEETRPFRVLGTADVRLSSRGGYINNVMVRSEARGRGLGELLMTSAEDFVGKGKTLELDVDTNNEAAVSLYRKLGYSVPGVHQITSVIGETLGLPLRMAMKRKT